ncbi:hypothetical protein [Candidatus Enterococcus clewellii]|uniref:Uncharacterized protein n=1 Tax=Candidatus Enterococcus clewellii TaxID=1834193 RepID=A0AAQ3Y255_9ENTE
MKINDELILKKIILESLNNEEKLLSFSFSKNKKSAYVTLVRANFEYITFRISDHRAFSRYYSNPTFVFNRYDYTSFEKELIKFMGKAQWYKFEYNDFYLLYVVKFAHKYHVTFLIDNIYNVFNNEDFGIVFYQEKIFNKKKKDLRIVPEKMMKYLRKLYATGLINSRSLDEQVIDVYITEQGMRMLDATLALHLERFMSDYREIDWTVIDMPCTEKSL